MRQIVLDTETTGLEPEQGHRIIEIGCVDMINRRLTGRTFHHYLNPERDIDPGAQEVHGLSATFLADKPLFAEVADDFLEFVRGHRLSLADRDINKLVDDVLTSGATANALAATLLAAGAQEVRALTVARG